MADWPPLKARLRATPFPGSPSQAFAAGWCPGCGGTGQVDRSVPTPGTYLCSTCGGGGTIEAMEAHLDGLRSEDVRRRCPCGDPQCSYNYPYY